MTCVWTEHLDLWLRGWRWSNRTWIIELLMIRLRISISFLEDWGFPPHGSYLFLCLSMLLANAKLQISLNSNSRMTNYLCTAEPFLNISNAPRSGAESSSKKSPSCFAKTRGFGTCISILIAVWATARTHRTPVLYINLSKQVLVSK